MKGKQYLNAGDVVTFGHLGGHDVAPGQLAPKQPAEFQFVVSFSVQPFTINESSSAELWNT